MPTATGTYGPAGAPLTVDDDSSVTAQPPDPSDGLTLVKTVSPEVIRRGVPVSYVIRLINDNPFAAGPLDLIDTLPLGLVYVDGSAQVDGVDWPVTVDGQVVTFPDVVAAPQYGGCGDPERAASDRGEPGALHKHRACARSAVRCGGRTRNSDCASLARGGLRLRRHRGARVQ